MTSPPRWAKFAVGLILLLAIIEKWPKFGWPLAGILALGLLVKHPNVLKEMGLS